MKLKPMIARGVGLIVVVVWISGCEFSTYSTHTSSKDGNDYAAEPLSGSTKDYAEALNTSNQFVEFYAVNRDIEAAYQLLRSDLQENVPLEQLAEFRSQADLDGGFGEFVEYLPNQWAFTRHTEADGELLISVKIVRFENFEAFFLLAFEENYQNEIVGFKWLRREREEEVSDFLNRVLQRP